jgi:phosphotransferase system HPr (HPr) family protein
MSQLKATRTVTVSNPEGLHARAATLIANLVKDLPAKVELIKGDRRVDGTNVLQVLSLCVFPEEQLVLEATGDNAEVALDALVELFQSNFNQHETAEHDENG